MTHTAILRHITWSTLSTIFFITSCTFSAEYNEYIPHCVSRKAHSLLLLEDNKNPVGFSSNESYITIGPTGEHNDEIDIIKPKTQNYVRSLQLNTKQYISIAKWDGSTHNDSGETIAVVDIAGNFCLFDINGNPLIQKQFKEPIHDIAWSSDGMKLAFASKTEATILDTYSRQWTKLKQSKGTSLVSWKPQKHILAFVHKNICHEPTTSFYDYYNQKIKRTWPNKKNVIQLAWALKGKQIISLDKQYLTIKKANGECIGRLNNSNGSIPQFIVSPTGKYIAYSNDTILYVHNLHRNTLDNPITIQKHTNPIEEVLFTPKEQHIISRDTDCINFSALDTSEEISSYYLSTEGCCINTLACSPGEKYFTILSEDGDLVVMKMPTS